LVVEVLKDSTTETPAGGVADLMLICDPIFSGRRTMSIKWTYNLFNLGQVRQGKYLVNIKCDEQLSKLVYSHRSLESRNCGSIVVELDLYVDPGNNCLHAEKAKKGETESLRATGTPIPIELSGKAAPKVPGRKSFTPQETTTDNPVLPLLDGGLGVNETEGVTAPIQELKISPLVQRVVASVIALLQARAEQIRRAANESDGGGSSHAPADFTLGEGDGYKSTRKRKASDGENGSQANGDEDDDEDGNDDGNEGSGPRHPSDRVAQRNFQGRFVCPFFKNDPAKYQSERTCAGSGWDTIYRLKYVFQHSWMLANTFC
jgi:hypothetical protein